MKNNVSPKKLLFHNRKNKQSIQNDSKLFNNNQLMREYQNSFDYIYNVYNCHTNDKQLKKKMQEQKQEKHNHCKHCGQNSTFICQLTANRICSECGFVIHKIYNTDAEWRYYGYADDNKHNDPTRCGLPVDELLPKSSLTTRIKYAGSKYVSLVRLHKWNVIHPEERSLFTVFKYMDKILANVNITNTAIVQAKEYYKILSEKDDRKGTLTRGIIRKSFIAACIYVACKNNNTPVQKASIAKICGINRFCITKGFKKFSRLEMNKGVQLNKPNNDNTNIHNFLHIFANQLQFTQLMEDITHIICDRLPKLKLLQDTNDISISAGLLYYITVLFYNHDEYRNKILNIINTSVVTLQKVYKILKQHDKYILIGLMDFINLEAVHHNNKKRKKSMVNKKHS